MLADIRAALLDIDGTLTEGVGGPALPGAVAAVERLLARLPIRYVTNTTSRTRADLEILLRRVGFPCQPGMLVNPALLAQKVLTSRGDDRGILIANPQAAGDLAWFQSCPAGAAKAVLLACESHSLTIAELGPAVEALLNGARLYTLQQNRVFRRDDRMVTDLGPVAAFLGYAARCSWENFGKPSPLLFSTLAEELDLPVAALAMVGDDAEFDAAGAVAAGCGAGVLVRTGKYRPGDETRVSPTPTLVLDDLSALSSLISLSR